MTKPAQHTARMTSAKLAGAIQAGDISAAEICEDAIARIDHSDGKINAFTRTGHLRARREAAAVDAMRARGEVLPTLAGCLRVQRFRRLYQDRVNALFADWDVLLAPATPVAATPIGSEWIDINGSAYPARPSLGLLTQPVSFAGCPVVAAPLWPTGTTGLPIGVQIIAAPWREDLALRAAYALQSAGVAHLTAVEL